MIGKVKIGEKEIRYRVRNGKSRKYLTLRLKSDLELEIARGLKHRRIKTALRISDKNKNLSKMLHEQRRFSDILQLLRTGSRRETTNNEREERETDQWMNKIMEHPKVKEVVKEVLRELITSSSFKELTNS